jgi:hypothetical protein
MKPPKILVIHDSLSRMAMFWQNQLKDAGKEVVIIPATTGDCFQRLEENPDIAMVIMTTCCAGLQLFVANKIKDSFPGQILVVVDSPEYIEQFASIGLKDQCSIMDVKRIIIERFKL